MFAFSVIMITAVAAGMVRYASYRRLYRSGEADNICCVYCTGSKQHKWEEGKESIQMELILSGKF